MKALKALKENGYINSAILVAVTLIVMLCPLPAWSDSTSQQNAISSGSKTSDVSGDDDSSMVPKYGRGGGGSRASAPRVAPRPVSRPSYSAPRVSRPTTTPSRTNVRTQPTRTTTPISNVRTQSTRTNTPISNVRTQSTRTTTPISNVRTTSTRQHGPLLRPVRRPPGPIVMRPVRRPPGPMLARRGPWGPPGPWVRRGPWGPWWVRGPWGPWVRRGPWGPWGRPWIPIVVPVVGLTEPVEILTEPEPITVETRTPSPLTDPCARIKRENAAADPGDLNQKGMEEFDRNNFRTALCWFELALKRLEAAGRTEETLTVNVLENLAKTYEALGKREDAASVGYRASTLRERLKM